MTDRATARRTRRITVSGIVQGVGFRPFVYALATELGLGGHVGNDTTGVFIEIDGPVDAVEAFERRLLTEPPPLADIRAVVAVTVDAPTTDTASSGRFVIVESAGVEGPRTLVPPDVATCETCRVELADPADRRYRYPFVNCTNCGPRFTIIRDLPYDRSATTMADFELCADCAAEYADPTDRRYHAQPVACPACGPRLVLHDRDGRAVATGTDAVLAHVHRALARGEIVALKGLGGYHLVCDAGDPAAVELLRTRKGRSGKPFAVMVPDTAAARRIAAVGTAEEEVLTGPARPIVLLRRRPDAPIAPSIAPENPLLGVMLPYTPLHHLLFAPVPDAGVRPPTTVVMTSGNRSNEPICFEDDDARTRLGDLADVFCLHNRPIERPCDDSVVRVVDGELQPIRRSRGFAPVPVELPFDAPPVIGVGGELKNTCCLASGRHAWVGQHIGDMENLATLSAFEASVDAFTTMYRLEPTAYGVDRHPRYLTRRWAIDRVRGNACGSVEIVDVQHHHAHVAAVMAEHGVPPDAEVLGVAFDGTGFGEASDGSVQIWGGEILCARYDRFQRVAHLAPLPLPGGDDAVRNPCRTALAYLTALGIEADESNPAVRACDDVERSVVPRQIERNVGCTPTTSIGRLFDAVSSLLGVRHRISYEAQAAIELEHLAERGDATRAPLAFSLRRPDGPGPATIEPDAVIAGIVARLAAGAQPADLAAAFHVAVADVVAEVVTADAGGRPVALTGGAFQNALLTRLVRERLGAREVLTHRLVPANDGGLSLGQAVVAAASINSAQGAREGRS